MTGDRVLAFDMNTTRAVQIAPPAHDPAPEAAPRPVTRPRLEGRARLASLYAGLLGADLSTSDLAETLETLCHDRAPDLDDLAQALNAMGLRAQTGRLMQPQPRHWPALVLKPQRGPKLGPCASGSPG